MSTANDRNQITRPVVFISYSRKDEEEKDQLLSQLGVLERQNLIDVWSADQIDAGAEWKSKIEQAIAQARVAILLITANFLTSDFILDTQIPDLLQRREREGLVIYPVIAKACPWKSVEWLKEMEVRPRDGQPVWQGADSHVDADLAKIAEEVSTIVRTFEDMQDKFQETIKPQLEIDKTDLREIIVTRYSLEGVRTLCEDCGVDYEELGQTAKEPLVRELVRELERRGELGKLRQKVGRK